MVGNLEMGYPIIYLSEVRTFAEDSISPCWNPRFLAEEYQYIVRALRSRTAYDVSYLSLPRSNLYVGMNVMRASE